MARKTLQADVEWKAGADTGEIEGYAAVFGNVDLEGDVVEHGAFRSTVEYWRTKATQPMPLIADHNLTTDGVVGSIVDMAEDGHGLRFKARFGPTSKAQDLRQNVLAGHIRGVSFTYEAMRSRPGKGRTIGGKAVRRFLEDLRVWEITLSPFPVNQLAGVTNAKAWDGSASRFTPEQWRRSCLIDTGEGDADSKSRYKLPVREPSGALNPDAVHAAASALAGGRGGVNAPAAKKKSAARALIRLYGEIGDDPPDSLRQLAGAGSAAMSKWLRSMEHAVAIHDPFARKAAVDELVASYDETVTWEDVDEAAGQHDDAATADDSATDDGGTSPDDAYAVSFLNGPHDGAPEGQPSDSLPTPIAMLEQQRSNDEIDTALADIQAALEA